MLAVGWVIFFIWLIATIFRAAWHGISCATGIASPRPRPLVPRQTRCTRLRCRAMNPPEANFCRRCGAALTLAARSGAVQRQIRRPVSEDRWASSPISL
jgi:hypothetical protein